MNNAIVWTNSIRIGILPFILLSKTVVHLNSSLGHSYRHEDEESDKRNKKKINTEYIQTHILLIHTDARKQETETPPIFAKLK